ncbi:TraR/DksA C4-type zinc finger protein [Glaciihabitans sp. UYNi722]|uniref:TraR/DksA family transcriptional regulator n=1 Tax=Glaciihabitans sp. UYNi722 TaxID=3156344 RepID=UPI003399F53B
MKPHRGDNVLTASQIARLKQVLRVRKIELDDRVNDVRIELADLREARADASADDEHDPEGSTLSSDWSRIQGLREHLSAQQCQVDAALLRMDDGSYGICINCDGPIGFARLEAQPAAMLCIDCARAVE